MKTDVTNFGFEVLVTFLLPGLLAAIAVAIFHGITLENVFRLLDFSVKAEFLASFGILAIITLTGSVVASVQAAIETWALDPITRRLMRIKKDVFNTQWDNYVASLTDKGNLYIARVVMFFQFETRMGLAMLLLGIALFRVSWGHAVAFIVGGIAFYAIGVMHHKELAIFRKIIIRTHTSARRDRGGNRC